MLYRMLLLFFVVNACQPPAKDPQPELGCIPNYVTGCRPVVKLKDPAPTRLFVGDAHLDRLTRFLAAKKRVESENVGFSGSFSEVYQVYAQLREQASLEQLRLLLQHQSVNVRYYALLALTSRDPEQKDSHYQQLAGKYDNLEYLSGCVVDSGELWEFAKYAVSERLEP